jgi:hypothetical protein
MTSSEAPSKSARSFLRTNQGLLYLAVVLAVPAFILSLLIGLNPAFMAAILILFVAVSFLVHRWRGRRTPRDPNSVSNVSTTGALAAAAVFVLIQLVPYGRSHSNGPVIAEPAWPSTEVRSLMVNACFDCHSNEVSYPLYSNIAPLSWLVAEHVSEGRSALNFSNFKPGSEGAEEVIEVISERSMPPAYFTRFGRHPKAKLSKAEISTLLTALRKMPEFKEDRGG